jgi:two-component system response regulator FixJ
MASSKMKIEGAVYVVDDDEAVRDSLALLLEAAGLRVEAFAGAAEALRRCRDERPACVVTDVRMPEMDGLELQRQLSRLHAQLPVIVITGHGDVPLAVQAMKAGAVDFIEKPVDDELLLGALAQASAQAAAAEESAARKAETDRRLARLTPRERQVLAMVIDGRHNREVAAALGISPRTVEVYKARLMDKLDVERLPDLIRLSLEHSLHERG